LTKKRRAKKRFRAHVGAAARDESAARNESGRPAPSSRHLFFEFFFRFEKERLLVESFELKFVVHDSTHFSVSRLLNRGR
jgi:hypothetical protein